MDNIIRLADVRAAKDAAKDNETAEGSLLTSLLTLVTFCAAALLIALLLTICGFDLGLEFF